MSDPKPLLFALYEQASVGCGGAPSLWTHPADERLAANTFDFWSNQARIADQANLDMLFFADVLGFYDVFGGSAEAAVKWAVEAPANDPLMIIPGLAAITRNLAFGATVTTTYEHPFTHARRFSTLDHMTNGRIAWNIVTSYLFSAARNFGLEEMVKHADRYERAEEFMDVAYKLWEGSWADDAVVQDKAGKRYARGERVRPINHCGERYRVAGPHLTAPSPQRTPLLIQAGWSGRGREFAAKHAELIFIAKSNPHEIRQGLEEIWTMAQARGRDRDDVKSLTVLRIVTAKTEIEAQRKYDELQSNYHLEAQLVSYAGDTGIDLSRYADGDALSTHTEGLTSYMMRPDGSGKPLTAGDVRKRFANVTRGTDLILVGTPEQVANRIEEHARISGTSGYMLNPLTSPGTLEDFVELIVPELQKRGLYRTQAQTGTFRSRLRDDRSDRLPSSAYGASFRQQ
ncbi:TPA: LLM class flavin-dependent oxidoreductase [Pseudomonas putida]|uniref:LLM class flavin-dependent oxidoreductase n=1 Tax=Pseudomonas putida TaxID=303 RepID=UPI00110C93C8|nr:LLM class flavin-dependent oxidoreductase [Pseudomonas putida]MDD1993203.1 LLM class flavin-dependent oxidoreductase [Pseudomonas putida]HDS0917657.1 LLM class flavin-dependent oxidoreductase [Pseudomonas putida]HDS0933339.1 LLM class flavin-dependent oxidoreductase [Pseudomonas putida]HDS1784373.1 LLM class flavin-dependent oxidoreductase [Pseudomonas putida]HDS3797627.1 LLM class flavin-dependent oxidoreductase [Pseudomonas putida]